jgi:hypothetical protein
MPGFDPKSGHVRFVVNKVALGQIFLRVATSVFPPLSTIPPILYTHLHLHVGLTRKPNGQSLVTFQKALFFRNNAASG